MKPKVTQDPPASLKRKRDEDDDAAEAEHDVFRRQPSEDDRPVKRRNLGTAFTVGAPPPPPKPRAGKGPVGKPEPRAPGQPFLRPSQIKELKKRERKKRREKEKALAL
eukprot:EG_transcript_48684